MVDSCIIYGIQRAGNHLVMSLLKALGMKEYPNTVKIARDNIKNMPLHDHYCFSSHQPYVEDSSLLKKYKGIYISRDLRDVAVSQSIRFFKDINQLPQVIIKLKHKFLIIDGWKNHPKVYHTTFEKLIGQNGGGDILSQKDEIFNISTHLNIPLKVFHSFFGDNEFFYKGQIGSHKQYFTKDIKKLYDREVGL